MKVMVKAPFFDENGLHKKGEVVEVKNFREEYMELIEDGKKEKVEKAVAKTPKKTTRKKV